MLSELHISLTIFFVVLFENMVNLHSLCSKPSNRSRNAVIIIEFWDTGTCFFILSIYSRWIIGIISTFNYLGRKAYFKKKHLWHFCVASSWCCVIWRNGISMGITVTNEGWEKVWLWFITPFSGNAASSKIGQFQSIQGLNSHLWWWTVSPCTGLAPYRTTLCHLVLGWPLVELPYADTLYQSAIILELEVVKTVYLHANTCFCTWS